jgi:hypothetical protein
MSKRQIKLLGWAFFLLLSLVVVSSGVAQSFDPVFEWTKRLQKGEEIELKIHVDPNSFAFLRSQATNINQSTFERLLGDDVSQLSVDLKILPGGELIIGYEVSELLRLEETWKEDQARAWKKIEFVQIASYSLTRWPDFIEQAVSQGLTEYEAIEDEGNLYVFLTFKQTGPSELRFGKQSLRLSDEFYEYMRIPKESKPWAGTTDRFVLLVHEPHWSLAGQYQLLPGLRALIDANSQYKFRFLVEGYFTEEIKHIPTESLLEQFSGDVSTRTQVFSLLRNALIDGPFAYRLIYDPDLPAVVIDNPELIQKTPPEKRIKGWIETSGVLRGIIQKLEDLPSDKTQEAQSALIMLSYYARADKRELKGQALIDCELQLAELYETLAKSLNTLQAKDFAAEVSFLKAQAEAYRTNAKRFQNALDRDATMAMNISQHSASKEYSERIPVAFIGNFHTPAITSHLRSKGIGYVVMEPRASLVATEGEQKNFNNALNANTRQAYLRKLAGDLKLQVAPTEAELPYYRSFLRRRETPRIRAQRAHFQQSFQSLGPNKVDLASLNNALETNGFLNGAQVSFAGNGQTPPPPFQRAFGYFSLGPEGEPPELVFFHPEDNGWERQDRYRFLQKVSLILPYEEIQRQTQKVRFYQDQETKRIFCSYFDSESQRFYLFEGDKIDIFRMLPLPTQVGHIRTAIRDLIYSEKEELYG